MLRTYRGVSPAVHDTAFVSEMAYLVGDVALASEASVWPFVCLRGDFGPVTVGERTNVQEFSMIHDSTLGDGVTVGHHVVVDRAEVDDRCLLGIGARILPGAATESNCIIAAGAVVREGTTVPEGHLAYGVPAKTRPLEDADRITEVTDTYADLAREYRNEGDFGIER